MLFSEQKRSLIFVLTGFLLFSFLSFTFFISPVRSEENIRWSALESNRQWILLNPYHGSTQISPENLAGMALDHISNIGGERVEAFGHDLLGPNFKFRSSIRWHISDEVGGDLDIIFPLYDTVREGFFLQNGISIWQGHVSGKRRIDYNTGLGWRRFIGSGDDFAFGLAFFYDHNLNYDLNRFGISMDIQSGRLTSSLNGYFPLSKKWHLGRTDYEERALMGGDLHFDYALTDRLNIKATGSIWEKGSDAVLGARVSGAYKFMPGISFSGEYEYFSKNLFKDKFYLGLSFAWPDLVDGFVSADKADLFKFFAREKRILYEERERMWETTIPTVNLSASPAFVFEHAGATEVTVTAISTHKSKKPLKVPVRVDVGDSDSIATRPEMIIIPAGEVMGMTTFILTPNDNTEVDTEERTVMVLFGDDIENFVKGSSSEITIRDNEVVTVPVVNLSVDPMSVAENAPDTTVTVMARATRVSDVALTVPISVDVDSYAAAVSDFSITIPANSETGTGTFILNPSDNDIINTQDRKVGVSINGDIQNFVKGSNAEITITDDEAGTEPVVNLSVDPMSVAENAPDTTVTVTARATRVSDVALTVPISVDVDSYAAAVSDFSITIPANSETGTGSFILNPADNDIINTQERKVGVSINGDIQNFVKGSNAEITITDDEAGTKPVVNLSVDPMSVAENAPDTIVTVTARATRVSDVALTVPIRVDVDSFAAAVSDFSITIPANSETGTGTFILNPADNDIINTQERKVGVSINGDIQNFVKGSNAEITITDDEAGTKPVVNLSVDPMSVAENAPDTTVTVTATATRVSDVALTVPISVDVDSYAAAVSDFSITIPANSETGTGSFILNPIDNDIINTQERKVGVSINGDIQNFVKGSNAEITITDDEAGTKPVVNLSVDPMSVAENAPDTTVTVTARATRVSDVALTVPIRVDVDSYAAAVSDFSITIPANSETGTGTFILNPSDNDIINTQERKVGVSINGDIQNFVKGSNAEITITDDEAGTKPVVNLSVDPMSVAENAPDTTVTVTARATRVSDVALTVPISVDVDTFAARVSDFSITIPANSETGTGSFILNPADNDIINTQERKVGVSINGDIQNFVKGSNAEITITDDEAGTKPVVNLSVDPMSVAENAPDTTVTVTATATRVSDIALTVPISVDVDSYAATVSDFSITIPANSETGTGSFILNPIDNDIINTQERKVGISINGDIQNFVKGSNAEITITDDEAGTEPVVNLSVDPMSVAENAPDTTVTVMARATRVSDIALTVPISVDVATFAAAVSDFSITIPANSETGTGTFILNPADNDIINTQERKVGVSINGDIQNFVKGSNAEITITDDEAGTKPVVNLSVDPMSVAENAPDTTVTVMATATRVSDIALTVPISVDVDSYAAAVSDFSITIPANSETGTGTFILNPADNDIINTQERKVGVSINGDIQNFVKGSNAEITITDDEAGTKPVVNLSLDPMSVLENAPDTTVTVTARATRVSDVALTVPITVDVSRSGGATATSPVAITIPRGESTATTTFTLSVPTILTENKTVTVLINNTPAPTNFEIGSSATITIIDIPQTTVCTPGDEIVTGRPTVTLSPSRKEFELIFRSGSVIAANPRAHSFEFILKIGDSTKKQALAEDIVFQLRYRNLESRAKLTAFTSLATSINSIGSYDRLYTITIPRGHTRCVLKYNISFEDTRGAFYSTSLLPGFPKDLTFRMQGSASNYTIGTPGAITLQIVDKIAGN